MIGAPRFGACRSPSGMHPVICESPAFRSLETFTQAEFARWLSLQPPDDIFHYELLEGFIVREPPAGWPHGHVAAQILLRLGSFVRDHRRGFLRVAPDLAFEVLSPGTGGIDRNEKKRIYERNRVREYALADCADRSFTVFRLEADGFAPPVTLAGEAVLASRVLPGLEIPVAEVFADP